tara:strand:- start:174 stop:356 length:183 start_codon:yes stop_codon:yes gene_type:complete
VVIVTWLLAGVPLSTPPTAAASDALAAAARPVEPSTSQLPAPLSTHQAWSPTAGWWLPPS